MAEGDLFTTAKLVRARQKLTNLGYFDQVKATTSPGHEQGQDRRQHRGHREADRSLLDRRRVQLRGRPPRHRRPLPAQLPRPRLGGVPAHPRGRRDPAGHHRVHRAVALRPAPRRGLRPLQQPARVHRVHGQLPRRRHPLRPSHRGLLPLEPHLPAQPGRHLRRRRQRQHEPPGGGGHAHHVPDRRRDLAGHPRQRIRADPRHGRGRRAGLRGPGRATASSSGAPAATPPSTLLGSITCSACAPRAATRSAGPTSPCPCSSASTWAGPTPCAAGRRVRSRRSTSRARGWAGRSSSSAPSSTPCRSSSAFGPPSSTTSGRCTAPTRVRHHLRPGQPAPRRGTRLALGVALRAAPRRLRHQAGPSKERELRGVPLRGGRPVLEPRRKGSCV